MDIFVYGLQGKCDDMVVPQEFASVEINGSPGFAEVFEKFGIFNQQILDIQALAASTCFVAVRKLLDAQIEACAKAAEKDYQRLTKETNQLLSRYLWLKQSFTNIDHIWRDDAFVQYVNYHLELYTATRKAIRIESLDAVMETLRSLMTQMADIVQRRSEWRTNLALQVAGLFLSGAAILDLVKLAGDAYHLDALTQFFIGSGAWATVAMLIFLIGFRRRSLRDIAGSMQDKYRREKKKLSRIVLDFVAIILTLVAAYIIILCHRIPCR